MTMNPRHIHLVSRGLPVEPLRVALAANPGLWDENTARTASPESPHHGLSDIWARYASDLSQGRGPHESVWYPAADQLPVRCLVEPLLDVLHAKRLGGVLITRIPAGRTCRRHVDGGWHAETYQKFGIQIESHPDQAFHFDHKCLVTAPGDLFWFDNLFPHWVTNPTPFDRVTVIACIETDIHKEWQ